MKQFSVEALASYEEPHRESLISNSGALDASAGQHNREVVYTVFSLENQDLATVHWIERRCLVPPLQARLIAALAGFGCRHG